MESKLKKYLESNLIPYKQNINLDANNPDISICIQFIIPFAIINVRNSEDELNKNNSLLKLIEKNKIQQSIIPDSYTIYNLIEYEMTEKLIKYCGSHNNVAFISDMELIKYSKNANYYIDDYSVATSLFTSNCLKYNNLNITISKSAYCGAIVTMTDCEKSEFDRLISKIVDMQPFNCVLLSKYDMQKTYTNPNIDPFAEFYIKSDFMAQSRKPLYCIENITYQCQFCSEYLFVANKCSNCLIA